MNSTFTINEDIIRRLALRQKQETERVRVRRRLPLLRIWQGAPSANYDTVQMTPRHRWN
jgi:hypothetical protein